MSVPETARTLFDLPPEEFTAERDRISKELKTSGDPAGAAAVKALKRPSIAAYALNLVARQQPDLLARLLGAEERLRSATTRSEMDGAKVDRQQGIAGIVKQAQLLLDRQGRPATAPVTQKITSTLLAVGTDDEVRERLRAGTLAREASPGAFGSPVAVFGTTAEQERAQERQERIDKLRQEGEAKLAEAKRAEGDADRARKEAADLEEAAAAARDRAAKLTNLARQAEKVGRARLGEAEKLESR